MKIRSDFVSNSSSSSFIIDNVEKITTELDFDTLSKAILKCFPKDCHSHISIYNVDNLTDDQKKEIKSSLKGWGDVMNPYNEKYRDLVDDLKKYGKIDFDIDDSIYNQIDKPLEKCVIQTLNILKRNFKIYSLWECVNTGYAKVLIMFDENVLWECYDMNNDLKGYKSDKYTYKRFVEVLSNNLWLQNIDIDYKKLLYCFHGHPHQG